MREYIVLLDEEEAFYGYKDNAQELIRCKDCKYYPYGIRFCIDSYKHCKHMTDEGFCSWAVRKETS